jgi:hypothetical protein
MKFPSTHLNQRYVTSVVEDGRETRVMWLLLVGFARLGILFNHVGSSYKRTREWGRVNCRNKFGLCSATRAPPGLGWARLTVQFAVTSRTCLIFTNEPPQLPSPVSVLPSMLSRPVRNVPVHCVATRHNYPSAVVMKSYGFWDTTLCSPLKDNRRFVGTYRLYLQGGRMRVWKQLQAISAASFTRVYCQQMCRIIEYIEYAVEGSGKWVVL